MIKNRSFSRLVFSLLFLAAASVAGAEPSAQDPLAAAIADVAQTSQKLSFSLEQFSHAVAGDALCSVRPSTALDRANLEGDLLERQIVQLRLLLPGASPQQTYLAEAALEAAEARLKALGDALVWAPEDPGGGVIPAVTWCGGWVNCMILKTACTGCFKCYVGLIDCGCFNPCP